MSDNFMRIRKGLIVNPTTSIPTSSVDGAILFDDNEKKFKRWNSNANAWVPLGEGSGEINFLALSNKAWDAESGTTGWSTYKDAAAARPVDGTGGSPSVISSITTTTTTPLSGIRSFLLQKGSGNAQGEGWSVDFNIDNAHLARVLQVEFDYQVASGTFVAGNTQDFTTAGDSSLIVYLYDVTNNQLIEPTTFRLYSNASNLADKFVGNFQTSATSTSYRLIFHVARTETDAWTLKIDNVVVKPAKYTYGTPITDWVDFPSVAAGTLITATTTNPTYGNVAYNRAQWRRVGSEMEIRWIFRQTTGGTAGSGIYLFNLPPGFDIDLNKLNPGVASTGTGASDFRTAGLGYFSGHDEGVYSWGPGHISVHDSKRLKVMFPAQSGSSYVYGFWGSGYGGFHFAPLSLEMRFSVPIAGWSSSVKIAEPMELRNVYCRIQKTNSQTVGTSPTKVTFDTKIIDTTNSFNIATNEFVAPSSDIYLVNFGIDFSGTPDGVLYVYVNGTANATAFELGGGEINAILNLNAGDIVDIRASGSSSSITLNPINSFLNITKLPSSQALAQSEVVAGRVYKTSSQTVPDSTFVDVVDYIKQYDSHNAFNATTGVLTIPKSGLLSASAQIALAGSTSGNVRAVLLLLNGTVIATGYTATRADGICVPLLSVHSIPVKLGDLVKVQVYQSSGTTMSIPSISSTDTYTNNFSWKIE